ncbi:MAG: tRNA (adenosine(37)-N6)-threonylcarbamoyltransferase complex transferase subunit TsaD [Mycoplasma sp.]
MIKNILAIETSCDDTSISLLSNDEIISNVIISSADIQNLYGGVVPEVAARNHEKNIIPALKQAIAEFDISQIDLIAYTSEPGLRVSLNIGEALATSLSDILDKPLLCVNHLYAHIFSFYDKPKEINIEYPFLSLVISGGHTSIYKVESPTLITLLNATLDDAVGECYDKVARCLELGYPGGPLIDKLYDRSCNDIKFLKNVIPANQPFSFSGLKSAVLNFINSARMKNEILDIKKIASSFQFEIISIVIRKLEHYINETGIRNISIGGGVSCNSLLKEMVNNLDIKNLYLPSSNIMSSDNAAMIAIYANLISKNIH